MLPVNNYERESVLIDAGAEIQVTNVELGANFFEGFNNEY